MNFWDFSLFLGILAVVWDCPELNAELQTTSTDSLHPVNAFSCVFLDLFVFRSLFHLDLLDIFIAACIPLSYTRTTLPKFLLNLKAPLLSALPLLQHTRRNLLLFATTMACTSLFLRQCRFPTLSSISAFTAPFWLFFWNRLE